MPSRPISVTISASTPASAIATRSLLPAPHRDLTAAGVEPDGHRHPGGEHAHELGLFERCSAQHHAGHTCLEERVGGRLIAHTASGLDGHVDGGGDGSDDLTVAGRARTSGVEIDDVDPACALGGEELRLGDRVVGVHGLAVVVALVQPHGATVEEVDGGEQFHGQTPCDAAMTKARNSWRPVPPDFSGWNCVAHNDPRSTAAATGPP